MNRPKLNRPAKGFTLVELMICVVVVGVLSAVALPAYKKSVQKGQRSVAKGVLLENAQFLEKYATDKFSYTGGKLSSAISPKDVAVGAVRYNITNVIGADGSTFVLKATPVAAQADDECGVLSLSNTGVQTAAKTTDCW
ncbi:type IV pilin protein [Massilia scottii]|uniref:type IV pilin protein n=1 Tax=Massilia scottii TaxID=3057166 RepID=UPI002796886C|nr:type IV pilin protein [Massilia sp. CCM 9029]MDQ1831539.1 type IV pilin protein [Massilia sp. CCM 9029]